MPKRGGETLIKLWTGPWFMPMRGGVILVNWRIRSVSMPERGEGGGAWAVQTAQGLVRRGIPFDKRNSE
jgi:hypothetical protein